MATKLDLREELGIPILEAITAIENFQNQTLRPILKLQNEVYLAVFSMYASKQKIELSALSKEKKRGFIEQSLQKDIALKNIMIGITIGLFSSEELETYGVESKEFNKRIASMVTERIKSQIL
jgi:hypothetical protein